MPYRVFVSFSAESTATAEYIHQAQFALDIKKAVLPIYEKVFDVGYPLPKLDTLVVSSFR
jgi:aminopeptidase 2